MKFLQPKPWVIPNNPILIPNANNGLDPAPIIDIKTLLCGILFDKLITPGSINAP